MIEGDREITPQEAIEFQATAQQLGVLLIWTVTTGTRDHGARYTARPHDAVYEGSALPIYLIADTLDGLRDMLPPCLTRLYRDPNDLPVIVETWL